MNDQDSDKLNDLESFGDDSENDFDMDFDDDNFDDILAEEHDSDLDYLDDDFDMDFGDDDDDFDESFQDGLLQKDKSGFDFNKIVITGAVIVGLCVLGYQVITKRPETVERFKTALNMTGSTDGPVFDSNLDDEKNDSSSKPDTLEISDGFLKDPLSLDDGAADENTEQPPMPVPLSQEEQTQTSDLLSGNDDILTPFPEIDGRTQAFKQTETTAEPDASQQTPRGPDDTAQPENEAQKLLQAAMKERTQPQDGSTLQETSESTESDPFGADTQTSPVDSSFGFDLPSSDSENTDSDDVAVKDQTSPLEQQEDSSETQDVEIVVEDVTTTTDQNTAENTEPVVEETVEETIEEPQIVQRTMPKSAAQDSEAKQDTTSEKPVSTIRKQAVRRTGWVLRSAQPGKAWVSKSGQKDMKSLIVGDTLAGIGTIKSIEFRNGRWVVEGTRGRVNQ